MLTEEKIIIQLIYCKSNCRLQWRWARRCYILTKLKGKDAEDVSITCLFVKAFWGSISNLILSTASIRNMMILYYGRSFAMRRVSRITLDSLIRRWSADWISEERKSPILSQRNLQLSMKIFNILDIFIDLSNPYRWWFVSLK